MDESFPKPFIEVTSDEQAKALDDFKSILAGHTSGRLRRWPQDDQKCLRFLKARKFKVDESLKLAEAHIRWLDEYRPDEIKPEVVEFQRRQRKAFWAGKDKYGRPTLITVLRNHHPKLSSPEDTLRYAVYTLRKGIKKHFPEGVHNFVTIIDLTDMSRKNVDLAMGKALANCLQDNFPERQACSFIINAPWYFRMIWAVVTPFLQKDTINKIRVLGGDWKEQLTKYFNPEDLPRQYGGQLEVQMDPFDDHDPLSSEFSERDTMTEDELEHELQEMIEEFKREDEAAGRAGPSGASGSGSGGELDSAT